MELKGVFKQFVFLIALGLSALSFAQPADSLWKVWNNDMLPDSSRMKAMKAISWSILFRDYDSGYVLAELLYDLALQNDDKGMQAYSIKVMGISDYRQGRSEEALLKYKKGLEIAEREGLETEKANFYNNIGMVYLRQGNFDGALDVYAKAIDILLKQGDKKGLALNYNNLALVYINQENIPMGLKYLQMSLAINEELNDQRRIAWGYNNIGLLYQDQGELDKALSYLRKSEKVFLEINHKRHLAMTYSGLGVVYLGMGKPDSALIYHQKSLDLYLELNDEASTRLVYINIGNIYKIRSDFDNAMDYYNRARPIVEKYDDKKNMASLYFNMGSLYNKFQRFDEARSWCEKTYAIAQEHAYLEERKHACECLRDAYKGMNNLPMAYRYQEEYYTVKDSLANLENVEEVTRLEMKYAFDKEKLADSLAREEEKLKNQLAFQENLNRERSRRNAFMIFGVGVLILAGASFYRLSLIRKNNKQLEEKNQAIEKEKQRAEESERIKEQFFNNVSHEFRTPLTLILGPINRILKKVQDKEVLEEVNTLQRNANRLHGMINELLELYKLESGSLKLEASKTDMGLFLNRFVQSFESLARENHVKLTFTSSVGDTRIYLDTVKIEKVMGNLLSNAFKFVDSGGKIDVLVEAMEMDGRKGVKISVKDNGIGIPEDKKEHIFDRFYQVGNSLSRNYQGTGIGLSLSKELVELHHGSIWVESDVGTGSIFSFFLPSGTAHLQPEQIVEETEKPVEKIKSDEATGKPKVIDTKIESTSKENPLLMIVEDNPDMRSFIRTDFKDSYRILEAANGVEGLEKAIEAIPDVIISDVMMPEMDGTEFCDKVKSDERTSHIPVVMLTARSSVEQKIEGLQKGADAYIGKPFDSRELQVTVDNLVHQRQKLRERFAAEFRKGIELREAEVTSMDQQFLEKAINVVQQHISDPQFSVEVFCQEMAMSRVQLHRKLTALTNQSSSRFIRTIRLKRAAETLAGKSANVTETAYRFGFNNLSYFTKCFQEEYGVKPSEYSRSASS